ncbi:facilitated trehalose transporter Tret1-like [Ostrinia furnacalis]|uniref:facilitated trehalose transporter Tret1-like n=1 Tax=Ostrinia furnacalis TaxID=93504 RepID=UPI00103A7C03|nr:facilitated trehalose transporter Tret1-like [Ostrinia furnacalis]
MPKMARSDHIYFLRQAFVTFTVCVQSVGIGIMLGFPAILNPAIVDPDSDIKASSSDASWLASILGMAGVIGFFVLSPLLQTAGRKWTNILKNLIMGIGWIIFYYATSLPALYAARFIQGVSMGGIYINVILIGEYSDPDRRGYYTAFQKASLSAGTLFCHAMALSFTWRDVAAIAIIPPMLASILTCFWPESPFFLAMRGRFDECEKSFHWLNGTKRNQELKDLISSQRTRIEQEKYDQRTIRKWLHLLSRRDFRRALLIVAILTVAIDLSGRNFLKAYIVQIMTSLTGSKTTGVYFSILSDSLVIIALLLSSLVIKFCPRRRLLFTFGPLTVLTLIVISLVLFLKNTYDFNISLWVGPCLILFVNIVVHMGVSPVGFVIFGEIFPLDLKGFGSFFSGIVFTASYGTILKLTPVLMESLGVEGAYFIYGCSLAVCLVLLFFILPETKDKTLSEIESRLKGEPKSVCEKENTLLGVS